MAPEASAAPDATQQPEANATAPVPPPRPHTIEQASDKDDQLISVKWPILVPPPAAGPQFYYHVEHRPQVQKPKPRLPRFPGTATSPGSFNANGFIAHNTFFDSAKNPYSRPRFHQIGSGAINSAAIIQVFSMIKGVSSHICVLTLKPLLGCLALKKPLVASMMLDY